MVYRHFFGRLEIIPPLLSGRLLYRYAVGCAIAAKFTVHSAVHEIWSVYCQEDTKSLKLLHPDLFPRRQNMPKMRLQPGLCPEPQWRSL